jgi:hypothetical protein
VKFLLDEQLNPMVAEVLSVVGKNSGDEFLHICAIAGPGTQDDAIPNLCSTSGCRALITVNHKDFGAKKALYEALVSEGIHVIVVRPRKHPWTADQQASLLIGKMKAFVDLVRRAENAGGRILVRVTPSDVKTRTLDQLVQEIEGQSA